MTCRTCAKRRTLTRSAEVHLSHVARRAARTNSPHDINAVASAKTDRDYARRLEIEHNTECEETLCPAN